MNCHIELINSVLDPRLVLGTDPIAAGKNRFPYFVVKNQAPQLAGTWLHYQAFNLTFSLLFSQVDSTPRRGKGQKINNWESSRKGHSFLYNVELRNGELVIPQTGFYYIYSQTYFRFRENENEDSGLLAQIRNPKQLVQYVYKLTNYPEPILLMKSARTSCWSKKAEYGLYSIYQGGVFQLKREDRIFVSVSNGDIVDMDKEASFFGAFMIG